VSDQQQIQDLLKRLALLESRVAKLEAENRLTPLPHPMFPTQPPWWQGAI